VCGDRDACRQTMQGMVREGAAGALACLIETHLEILDGNTDRAIAAIQQAELLGPELPIVNYAAAIMYLRLSAWDIAEKRLRRAIVLDPAFQAAHDLLSQLLFKRGDSAQAADSALNSLEINYASALSHLALGLAMVGARQGDEALRAFERSVSFDPGLQEAQAWAAALRAEQRARGRKQSEN